MVERGVVERWVAGLLATTLTLASPVAMAAAPEDDAAPSEGAADEDAPGGGTSDGSAPDGSAPDEGAPDGSAPDGSAPDGAASEPEVAPEPEPADDTNAKAAEAFKKGSDLYELGKFAEAAEKFGEAWELSHKAPLLYNMGQAHWKWFDVDPDIDHLRQARLFFENYDKRMRLIDGYDPKEVQGYLEQIDAQIKAEEKRIEEANRPVVIQAAGLTEEEVQAMQRRRTTRALNISGNILIITGSVTLGVALGGLVSRAVYGTVLDTTSGSRGDVQYSLATAEEDRKRRNGFLTSGQVAFGSLIGGGIILPIGITLRVIGAIRHRKDGAAADEEKASKKKTQARIEPTSSGIRVRF